MPVPGRPAEDTTRGPQSAAKVGESPRERGVGATATKLDRGSHWREDECHAPRAPVPMGYVYGPCDMGAKKIRAKNLDALIN